MGTARRQQPYTGLNKVATFSKRCVDGEKLVTLDRQALISLGLTLIEHRRNFERALRKLTTSN